jgi:hypothetical protein
MEITSFMGALLGFHGCFCQTLASIGALLTRRPMVLPPDYKKHADSAGE